MLKVAMDSEHGEGLSLLDELGLIKQAKTGAPSPLPISQRVDI